MYLQMLIEFYKWADGCGVRVTALKSKNRLGGFKYQTIQSEVSAPSFSSASLDGSLSLV